MYTLLTVLLLSPHTLPTSIYLPLACFYFISVNKYLNQFSGNVFVSFKERILDPNVNSCDMHNIKFVSHNIKFVSHDMRFPTMWYVRPAKAQIIKYAEA